MMSVPLLALGGGVVGATVDVGWAGASVGVTAIVAVADICAVADNVAVAEIVGDASAAAVGLGGEVGCGAVPVVGVRVGARCATVGSGVIAPRCRLPAAAFTESYTG